MNCHNKFQITCQGNAKSHGNPRKLAAPRRFGSDRPITNGFFFLTLQHFFVSAVWSRRLAWPLSLSWFLLVRLKINDHVLYSRHVPDSSQRLPGKGVKRTFPSTIVFLILSTLPSPPLPSPLMPLMTRQPVSFHFCCFVISFDGKIPPALRS